MRSNKNIREIAVLLARIKEADLIEEFLSGILTRPELKTLAARWEIVKSLEQGLTQRKIARDLHLSLCNITRGARELKKKNSALKKVIHLIKLNNKP